MGGSLRLLTWRAEGPLPPAAPLLRGPPHESIPMPQSPPQGLLTWHLARHAEVRKTQSWGPLRRHQILMPLPESLANHPRALKARGACKRLMEDFHCVVSSETLNQAEGCLHLSECVQEVFEQPQNGYSGANRWLNCRLSWTCRLRPPRQVGKDKAPKPRPLGAGPETLAPGKEMPLLMETWRGRTPVRASL